MSKSFERDLYYSSEDLNCGYLSKYLDSFRLHLDNINKGKYGSPDYVDKFGFDIPTSCGSIPQKNTWCDNWPVSETHSYF